MIEQLSSGHGGMLWLICGLALLIYWQLFDLMQSLWQQNALPKTELMAMKGKIRQLLIWASALPLLGLLGTVSGLLDSFTALASGDQLALAGGIAQAMLTTQLGLSTAIPAVLVLYGCQRLTRSEAT